MPAIRQRGRNRRTMNEINMVPFIDVMLVLLIIFMVTAPLISPSQIALPSVDQAARQPDRFVQIVVAADQRLSLRDSGSSDPAQAVALDQLVARVRETQGGDGNTPVLISGDKAVPYEAVVQVMDRLQRAGIGRVGLSVQSAR